MIIFRYNISEPERFHALVKDMELPGTIVSVDDPEVNGSPDGSFKVLLHEGPFIAILATDGADKFVELYPVKNTNSVNYFKKRYPKMRWDDIHQMKTKRW